MARPLFFVLEGAGNRGFLRLNRGLSLIISCKNSKNSGNPLREQDDSGTP
jgi:hypothetical protein